MPRLPPALTSAVKSGRKCERKAAASRAVAGTAVTIIVIGTLRGPVTAQRDVGAKRGALIVLPLPLLVLSMQRNPRCTFLAAFFFLPLNTSAAVTTSSLSYPPVPQKESYNQTKQIACNHIDE